MKMKLISIIIATFNAESTLERCLSSICPQKSDCIELLLIDGGSKDSTLAIIDKYRMYIDYSISEADYGIYDAWNKGIEHSTGEWLMFIGADDTLLDYTFETYLSFLKKTGSDPYDYICAKANYMDSDNRLIKVIGIPWEWRTFKKKMDIVHVGSLHNRTLFQKVGQFSLSYKICGDYEFLLRKKERLKVAFINETLVKMQSGGASFTINAIVETRKIRELHSGLSLFHNWIICIYQILLFYRFKANTFLSKLLEN